MMRVGSSTLLIEFQAALALGLAFLGVFLTTCCRSRRCLGLPVGQPGDFPRVFGARMGVPIVQNISAYPRGTRAGVSSCCLFCQACGRSAAMGLAR